MDKDRIGVTILLLGLVVLLAFEAINYARKSSSEPAKPRAVTQTPGSQASLPSTNVGNGGAPEKAVAVGQAESSPSGEVEVPADWSVFTADEFGFQIARPANWPAGISGNVLTIGDPAGDGHTKCYVTIEF